MSDRILLFAIIMLILVVGVLVLTSADGSVSAEDAERIGALIGGAAVTYAILGWKGKGPKL